MSDARPTSRVRRVAIDPRLLIGVGLVVASVAGVLTVVAAADHRVTAYVAASTFGPGDRVGADDLLARRVSLDDAAGLYLIAGDLPEGGLVATAVVRRGELIPRSALGTEQGGDTTSIVLQVGGPVSESVVAGSAVDVWSSANVEAAENLGGLGGAGPPVVLVADAIVVRVVEESGFVSSADAQAVEVMVPRGRIARVLQAIANGDTLAIVPAGIPLPPR